MKLYLFICSSYRESIPITNYKLVKKTYYFQSQMVGKKLKNFNGAKQTNIIGGYLKGKMDARFLLLHASFYQTRG